MPARDDQAGLAGRLLRPRRSGDVGRDQGQRRRRHHRRRPLQHLRAGGRHARDDARDANTACRRSRCTPTSSTRSSRSVTRMGGLPQAPTRLRAAAGHGQERRRSCAPTSNGNDPVTGRPVMQEVIEALTRALAGRSPTAAARAHRRRASVEPDTEDNLQRAVPRQPLDRQAADRAADRGARRGDAGRTPASPPDEVVGRMQPTPNRGVVGIHRREGRRERGHGRRAGRSTSRSSWRSRPRRCRRAAAPRARRRRWWWSTVRSATRSA